MTEWLIWGFLLIAQQAAQTGTSRARNTKSLTYNAIASVFSNGVWFASQFFIVNKLIQVKDDPTKFILVLVFYITLTVTGSVGMHWYLMKLEARKHIERG